MLALLVPWLTAQSQMPTNSFTCRAEPMSRLVRDLSKATGLTLGVSKECAPDVLVVCAPSVTTQALLNEIAKIDAGTWKPEGSGYLFVADDATRRAQSRTERTTRAKKLKAGIIKSKAAIVKQEAEMKAQQQKAMAEAKAQAQVKDKSGVGSDDDGSADDFPDGGGFDVSPTRVLQLLQTIDPDDLVLDPGHRIVFSSHPNEMQYALGNDAGEVLAQIVQDHNEIVAKLNPSSDDSGQRDGGTDEGAPMGGGLPAGMNDDNPVHMKRINSFAKADLSVEERGALGMGNSLEATLRFYDAKGNVLVTASASVQLGNGPTMQDAVSDASQIQSTPPQTGTPIEFSEGSKRMLSLESGHGADSQIGEMLREASKLMGDPEHNDPLSYVLTDSLFSLSKLRQKPLVALVPDGAEEDAMSLRTTVKTVEGFESDLATGDQMTENSAGSWIEVMPALPDSSRTYRVERAALARFAKDCLTKGSGTLEDVSAFAQVSPSPAANVLTLMYVTLFSMSSAMSVMGGSASWELVRVFGGLSADERQTLISGNKLPLQLLGTDGQSSIISLVYGPDSHLRVGNGPDKPEPSMFGFMDMSDAQGPSEDYKSEPTEVLPNGIPSGGWLEMTAEQQPCFTVGGQGQEMGGFSFTVGLDEVASFKAMSEMGNGQNGMNGMLDRIQVGNRTSYHLTFHVANSVRVVGTLNDDRVAKDSQTYSMSTLPDDVRAKIQKKADVIKKMMNSTDAAAGPVTPAGGGTPPPG